MENPSLIQEIKDNWLLVWLFGLFIIAVLWALRPGSRKVHRESANIPFQHDDRPASAGQDEEARR